MDRNELINHLQLFKQQCDREGFTIDKINLEEAYPGIQPTPFIVCLVASENWQNKMDYSKTLDKLIDILWDTTKAEIRKSIFAVTFYDKNKNTDEYEHLMGEHA